MTLLVTYILLALGVSFLCSLMEAVLLSVTPSYIALLHREKHPIAPRLGHMKANIDRPLVAILTLNTIAHTAGAAGAGAQATAVWGNEWLGVFSAVLTLLILVTSEIIPKTLGAVYWRGLTPMVVRTLYLVIFVLFPLVWAMEVITKLFSRHREADRVSREEMGALAELGVKQGTLAAGESKILKSLFRFSKLTAQDVMTPRTVVMTLPETATVAEAIGDSERLRFSRLPLVSSTIDETRGYVLKDRLLLEAARGNTDIPVKELARPLKVVPYSAPLPKVLDQLLSSREHIALVVDEYGGTAGILSTEDIVETLLDLEIVDELDSVADMQAHARQAWAERARALGLVESKENETRGPEATSS